MLWASIIFGFIGLLFDTPGRGGDMGTSIVLVLFSVEFEETPSFLLVFFCCSAGEARALILSLALADKRRMAQQKRESS